MQIKIHEGTQIIPLDKEWVSVIQFAQEIEHGVIALEIVRGVPKMIRVPMELPYKTIKPID